MTDNELRGIRMYHVTKRMPIDPDDTVSAIERIAQWHIATNITYLVDEAKRVLAWVADVRALEQKEHEYNGRR